MFFQIRDGDLLISPYAKPSHFFMAMNEGAMDVTRKGSPVSESNSTVTGLAKELNYQLGSAAALRYHVSSEHRCFDMGYRFAWLPL
jgi:hypothetical protein